MKKILAIVGSPRKGGNTDILVGKIAEGARAKDAEVETIYLGDLNIKECNGCHLCWQGKRCPKIIAADTIIFGTPVYWYGPTALMKAFIDRFVYFNCPDNRAKIKGKNAALAIPFEEENLEMARPVVEFFEKTLNYLEMDLTGRLIAPGVGAKGDVLGKPERLEEARLLGEKLA